MWWGTKRVAVGAETLPCQDHTRGRRWYEPVTTWCRRCACFSHLPRGKLCQCHTWKGCAFTWWTPPVRVQRPALRLPHCLHCFRRLLVTADVIDESVLLYRNKTITAYRFISECNKNLPNQQWLLFHTSRKNWLFQHTVLFLWSGLNESRHQREKNRETQFEDFFFIVYFFCNCTFIFAIFHCCSLFWCFAPLRRSSRALSFCSPESHKAECWCQRGPPCLFT